MVSSEEKMGLKALFKNSQAALSMILVQLLSTGTVLLSKIVLNRGTFIFSLLTYRQIVAAFFLAPFAFFMERKMLSKLSWMALPWIFFNGLFGITMAMGLYYYGLQYTSATFASNFLNLIPITTFILSTIAGMEKLGLGSKGGRIKVAGTMLCVAGALSVKLFKVYPSVYWATMLSCLAGSLQSAIIGIALDRGKAAWSLGWDMQLLTIFYSGVLTTGANFCLISWAVSKRGPTYPSMFSPVSLVFVTILESLFMGEEIFIGSILGMLMITGGLYAFLWGKRNELPPHDISIRDVALDVESPRSQPSISLSSAHHIGTIAEEAHGKETKNIKVVTVL
ncbi:WAT1-related protein At5g07050-like isoform X2 [Magnolia sinica]|uniref:WAT1-related protein At5g07050-like isoform X2 n=1 Tax=Magnolia sinica TaxID=86752 RepID=UPI0026598BB4|nr:WAT1-related protein At5g07050-like isoform X2 [Magnolia sinica]